MTDLSALKNELAAEIEVANDLDALEKARVSVLGKNGKLTAQMKTLGTMTPEERKEKGQALNVLKNEIVDLIARQEAQLKKQAMAERLASESVDVTLSPRPERKGTIHPISRTMEEIITIFADMGFTVAEGPELEDDFHNFTALNFPEHHPAREMQDTFFLPEHEGKKYVMRTHTSPVQIRSMMSEKPPLRLIVPGRVYRQENHDATHTSMFHQVEGLVIDKNTHMGHLKGTLKAFCEAFFQVEDLPMRFRPSFFPFTEPSAEVDIGCSRQGGKRTIGGGDDWLEILGCGMVHPNVIRNCGLDPAEYQGFAFGMGVERMVSLKYGFADIRDLFEADTRWLSHYGFDPLAAPNLAHKDD